MKLFNLKKYDNKTEFYINNYRLFALKRKSKYRKIYEKRFKGLTEAEQRYILETQFIKNTGYPLNLDNPQTFNEKIQWLKMYDHNPLMTVCADKVSVRDYVKEKLGEEYLIPCLGVWDSPDDIEFDRLPNKFVLKVNWGSGQNIIVKDKSQLDIEMAKKQLTEWMKPENNHYYDCLEWCYKDIKPKILCEQYLESKDDLRDYKFYCFHGKAEIILVCGNRSTDKYYNFYDMNFNFLPFKNGAKNSPAPITMPVQINKMRDLAQILAQPFVHARIDFYEKEDGSPLVGEITFYTGNGTDPFDPQEWDYKLGKLLQLPEK